MQFRRMRYCEAIFTNAFADSIQWEENPLESLRLAALECSSKPASFARLSVPVIPGGGVSSAAFVDVVLLFPNLGHS